MAEHRDGRLARRQAMLCEQVRYGAIRGALLAQFDDDILRGHQVLELLWAARRKFIDRLADCGWVKCRHDLKWCGCEPGNGWLAKRPRQGDDADNSRPARVRDCCRSAARSWQRQVWNHAQLAEYSCPLPRLGRGQLIPRLGRGCGMVVAAPVGVVWMRTWTVRGHGSAATAACLLPVRVRGYAAIVVVRDSYRAAVLWIHRDDFADAESFGTKG